MKGWRRRLLVVGLVAGACQQMPDVEFVDGSDSSGSDASTVALSEGSTGGPSTSDAMPCWTWEPSPPTAVIAIAAMTDGDLVVTTSTAITRLDPNGNERWTIQPPSAQVSSIVALPDGGFAALGRYANGPAAFARAFDAGGHVLWDAPALGPGLFLGGAFRPGTAELVVVGRDADDATTLETLDALGVSTRALDVPAAPDGGRTVLEEVAVLGDGFVVVGGIELGGNSYSVIAGYGAAGESTWVTPLDYEHGKATDVATLDADTAVVLRDGGNAIAIDRDGVVEWSWGPVGGNEGSITVSDDGRSFVAPSLVDSNLLVGLAADGAEIWRVESRDELAFRAYTGIAWSAQKVFVSAFVFDLEQAAASGLVECWDPPGD